MLHRELRLSKTFHKPRHGNESQLSFPNIKIIWIAAHALEQRFRHLIKESPRITKNHQVQMKLFARKLIQQRRTVNIGYVQSDAFMNCGEYPYGPNTKTTAFYNELHKTIQWPYQNHPTKEYNKYNPHQSQFSMKDHRSHGRLLSSTHCSGKIYSC